MSQKPRMGQGALTLIIDTYMSCEAQLGGGMSGGEACVVASLGMLEMVRVRLNTGMLLFL